MTGPLKFAALIAILVGCWLVGTATAQTGGITPTDADLRQAIRWQRTTVHKILTAKCLENPYKPYQYKRVADMPADRLKAIERTWGSRLHTAKRVHYGCYDRRLERALWRWFDTSGARCVKSREGAWTSNTGNGYYGGFQADLSFQRAYGGEYLRRYGTADRWPPVAQIHMAWRGWRARGWAPWPNTARACGLL